MNFDEGLAPQCTPSMAPGLVDDRSVQENNSNRTVERWLASSGPCSGLKTISHPSNRTNSSAGVPLQHSQLSPVPKPWPDQMSVLPVRSAGLAAKQYSSTPSSHLDVNAQQRYSADLPGSACGCQAPQPLPCQCHQHLVGPPQALQLTNWPISLSSTQLWMGPLQNSKAINPKGTFTTYSLSPAFDGLRSEAMTQGDESTDPTSDYDPEPYWEREVDVYSNFTPATTFSQCSSARTWPESQSTFDGLEDFFRTNEHCPCRHPRLLPIDAESSLESPSLSRAVQSQVSSIQEPRHVSSASIPKSVPSNWYFAMGYASPDVIRSPPTGEVGQGLQPSHDATFVSKFTAHGDLDYAPNGFSQTLEPFVVGEQLADLHAAELSFSRRSYDLKPFDQPEVCQEVANDVASTMFQEGEVLNHCPKAEKNNNVSPSNGFSQSQYKSSRSNHKLPNSSSRSRLRDEFLVRSKLAGMSYRDIRAKGHFKEAESTLRGRFRTLTKRKEQRIKLLEHAVREALENMQEATQQAQASGDGSDLGPKPPKIPWKQVSERIYTRGGSYKFGNATCRKKWDETFGSGQTPEDEVEDE